MKTPLDKGLNFIIVSEKNRLGYKLKGLLFEDQKSREHQQNKARDVVPAQVFAQIVNRKQREHRQRDDFLQSFQLGGGIVFVTDAVGGNLQTVFEKRDAPADQNDRPQRGRFEFQMTVPRECHENIGTNQ